MFKFSSSLYQQNHFQEIRFQVLQLGFRKELYQVLWPQQQSNQTHTQCVQLQLQHLSCFRATQRQKFKKKCYTNSRSSTSWNTGIFHIALTSGCSNTPFPNIYFTTLHLGLSQIARLSYIQKTHHFFQQINQSFYSTINNNKFHFQTKINKR